MSLPWCTTTLSGRKEKVYKESEDTEEDSDLAVIHAAIGMDGTACHAIYAMPIVLGDVTSR